MDRLASLEERLRPLMVAALGGDTRSYDRLLRDLSAHLRRYFARRMSDAAVVEDLFQETLLAIHRHRATWDTGRPLTVWIHAIARYKLIDHFRRSGRRATVPIDDVADFVADDRSETAEAVDRRDLETTLGVLPKRTGDMIRQVKVEGRSIAEVSAATGMSESAVKVSIHRGLKVLMARFGGQG